MKNIDVLIIGAGAAGLMCGMQAGARGKSVCVIDHANKPGKKILIAGGGRCNFTNLDVTANNFISHNPHFCKSALSGYTPWDFIELVKKHDIAFHEKTLGQLFCDNKSQDILKLLLAECEAVKVPIQMSTIINSITQKAEGGFVVKTTQGDFECASLVVATGGLSIPTMGAGPFGYQVAEQFGIKVWPTRAALVPFTWHTHDKIKFEALSGVSQDCLVTCNGQMFRENLLFTHRGLSGPAMLQISSYWTPGDALTIRLLPDVDLAEALKNAKPNVLLKNVLSAYFPKNIVAAFVPEADANTPLQDFSHERLAAVAALFQQWELIPNGTEGYRTAEVTLGGVDCNAVSSKTFEASNVKGLYFIGEVLDVTGWLGGYNFQWAWASAVAAAKNV